MLPLWFSDSPGSVQLLKSIRFLLALLTSMRWKAQQLLLEHAWHQEASGGPWYHKGWTNCEEFKPSYYYQLYYSCTLAQKKVLNILPTPPFKTPQTKHPQKKHTWNCRTKIPLAGRFLGIEGVCKVFELTLFAEIVLWRGFEGFNCIQLVRKVQSLLFGSVL